MKATSVWTSLILLTVVLVVGCGQKSEEPKATSQPPAPTATPAASATSGTPNAGPAAAEEFLKKQQEEMAKKQQEMFERMKKAQEQAIPGAPALSLGDKNITSKSERTETTTETKIEIKDGKKTETTTETKTELKDGKKTTSTTTTTKTE